MRHTVQVALFASLSAALGFLMAPLPNIELLTFCLFMSGYVLGAKDGAAASLLAVLLYYGLNPYGSSLIFPPLFAAQLAAGCVIALLGAGFARLLPPGRGSPGLRRLLLLPFAALAALALPLLPGFAFALVSGSAWQGWLALGALMTASGFLFNLVVFGTAFEALSRQVRRLDLPGSTHGR